jgi:hypothetical protein
MRLNALMHHNYHLRKQNTTTADDSRNAPWLWAVVWCGVFLVCLELLAASNPIGCR